MEMPKYLIYPEGYDEAHATRVNNGCGTAGWKGKLVPDTIYGISIRAACKIHDYDYDVGKTREEKNAADKRLRDNAWLLCKNKAKKTKFLNPLRRRRCRKYYLAVQWGGDAAFFDGKVTA